MTMRKVLVLSSEKLGGYGAGTPPPLDTSLKQILEFLIIKLEGK